MRTRVAALALAALLPVTVSAQSVGGAVPPYEPPPPAAAPQRDGEVMERAKRTSDAAFGQKSDMAADFAAAYARNGKPKLALFWNRQLSDTLNEWYSDVRIVNRTDTNSTMSGELTLNQSGSQQNTTAIEKRVTDPRRVSTSESFEWEFQDGFLAPFLEAGVTVLDRAAIMRLTGVDMAGTGERSVETRALQGKADYLMEVLVSPNQRSTVGYELRARILDVRTGAIVAMVNSKNLKEWNPEKQVLATDRGFVDPNDFDDDDSFGPEGEQKFAASSTGFHARRKPPKLSKIAGNLAHNTMTGLMRQWK